MESTSSARKTPTDWLGAAVAALVFVWIIGVSFAAQYGGWLMGVLASELLPEARLERTTVLVISTLAQAALLALPLAPLALFWRRTRARGAFQAWLASTVVLTFLGLTRVLSTPWQQTALLLQTLVFVAVLIVMRRSDGFEINRQNAARSSLIVAGTLGLVLGYAWLAFGALGSPLDIALGILCSATFGMMAVAILARFWLPKGDQQEMSAGWEIALGGFVLSGELVILASGLGPNVMQPLLLLALPPLGWAVIGVLHVGNASALRRNAFAGAFLLTLSAGAPLLLMDPDTTFFEFIITSNEMLRWGFYAALIGAAAAVLFGIALGLLRNRIVTWRGGLVGKGVLLLAAMVGALIYLVPGQPGLYGDRVFVILKSQADASGAAEIQEYDARRAQVYETLVNHAQTSQRGLRSLFDSLRIKYTPYYLVNALEVELDPMFGRLLALHPDVDRVIPSIRLRPLAFDLELERGTSPAPTVPQWNLTMIGADKVWSELGVRGKGIVIGQSDSGVQASHPELADTYRGRDGADDYDWLDPWFDTTEPADIGGHGTHTLATIVGKHVGVAPDAEWFGCVNLARNLGNAALYLDCLQFMLAPYPRGGDPFRDGDPKQGAMVLNNSWGCPDFEGCDPTALLPAARALRAAGVFVVASAGNDGPTCSSIDSPLSLYDEVFTVGAVDRSRNVASFSSRGPVTADSSNRVKPDIAAPGVRILSAYPGSTYEFASGTSMAGPHVVGVVALMWSANPKLVGDIDRTERILGETAQKADISSERIVCGDPSAIPNDMVGYGIVDAYAAVKRALEEQ